MLHHFLLVTPVAFGAPLRRPAAGAEGARLGLGWTPADDTFYIDVKGSTAALGLVL
jgi:hypothetical protein